MRRMGGRTPPYLIIGLSFICVVLAYNCWTIASHNGDLAKEIEDLQTEIKLGGVKQEQFRKKMQILQENLDDMESKASQLKHKFEEEEAIIKDARGIIDKKDNELKIIKNDLSQLQETKQDLEQQLEDKEAKIEILQKDSQHIISLKNEVDEVVAEKDQHINKLMRQLDQLTNTLSQLKKEKVVPDQVPGIMNIPDTQNKEPYLDKGLLPYVSRSAVSDRAKGLSGLIPHPGIPILPRQHSNAPRLKPKFSVSGIESKDQPKELYRIKSSPVMQIDKRPEGHQGVIEASHGPNGPPVNGGIEKPNLNDEGHLVKDRVNPVLNKPESDMPGLDAPHADIGHPVLHEPEAMQKQYANLHGNEIPDYQEKANVIPAPLQHPDENPDTAIDDEEKIIEDPSDDQDEEGKEIKKDLENNAEDNYNGDYDLDERLGGPEKNPKAMRNQGPRGIGVNMVLPREDIDAGGEDGREDVNVDEEQDQRAHDKVYDTNIENKIRNLGKI